MIKIKVKHLLLYILLFIAFFAVIPICKAVSIREGTFIKVTVPYEISTLLYDKGDRVCVYNSSDIYLYETNALPEGSVICGFVEDLLEPVQGRNAAIKIRMTKVTTPDKRIYDIDAYLYSPNNNYFGGEETPPAYYQKVPHYSTCYKPMLQFAPINVFEQGIHTVIKPGSELLLILNQPLEINE